MLPELQNWHYRNVRIHMRTAWRGLFTDESCNRI